MLCWKLYYFFSTLPSSSNPSPSPPPPSSPLPSPLLPSSPPPLLPSPLPLLLPFFPLPSQECFAQFSVGEWHPVLSVGQLHHRGLARSLGGCAVLVHCCHQELSAEWRDAGCESTSSLLLTFDHCVVLKECDHLFCMFLPTLVGGGRPQPPLRLCTTSH